MPETVNVKQWIEHYRQEQVAAIAAIPTDQVAQLIDRLRVAYLEDRQIFVFGNGGSAANASHFITDLGKGSSDKLNGAAQGSDSRRHRRFRCMSLNDNVSWMTALGNDYAYDEIFARQLINYARPGDLVLVLSVSGSSPNLVKAVQWAKQNGVYSIALVGGKRGKLADLADEIIVIASEHYGRAEDAQMAICHLLCYAFIENPSLVED